MKRVCGITHELLRDVIFTSSHRNSCDFKELRERENSSVSRCLPRRILLLIHLKAKQTKVLTRISLNFRDSPARWRFRAVGYARRGCRTRGKNGRRSWNGTSVSSKIHAGSWTCCVVRYLNLFRYKIYDSQAFLFKKLAIIEVFADSMNELSFLLFTMPACPS